MRALRASGGYAGCTLRVRLPSLILETRIGATAAGFGGTGRTGTSVPNELITPPGLPGPGPPGEDEADHPIDGGPSSLVGGRSCGMLAGCRKKITGDVLGATAVSPIRTCVGGSPSGCPKLIGAVSCLNVGKPIGRSSGRSSKRPVTKACKPNEVSVVQRRRDLSAQDECKVSAKMVSS